MYDRGLLLACNAAKIEQVWRSLLTFLTHVAFNTRKETSFEDRMLLLRTTRSAASSHAKTSPSTVCKKSSDQAYLSKGPVLCIRECLLVGREMTATSPNFVSSFTDDPSGNAKAWSVLATMVMPGKASSPELFTADDVNAVPHRDAWTSPYSPLEGAPYIWDASYVKSHNRHALRKSV